MTYLRLTASVEPSSSPGNTSFVAGFTQCTVSGWLFNIASNSFSSECRRHESKYVCRCPASILIDLTSCRLGAFCESPGQVYDGQPCESNHSTCGGKTEDCHGRGPGFQISDFESNRIIGEKQFEGAQQIMGSPLSPVQGGVKSVHVYLDM
jgi:neutral ceramidase